MRRPSRRSLVALGVLFFAAACNNSTSEPGRIVPLTGTLAKSATDIAFVDMGSTGNMRVRAVELAPLAADGTATGAAGAIVFGVGEGSATTCTATGAFSLVQGGV